MDIHIHQSPTEDAAELRVHALTRVRQVLKRMHRLIQKAVVRLVDVNGPRGGTDKTCQVQLVMPGQAPLIVSSQAANWREALDNALARASHAVLRRVDQGKPRSIRNRAARRGADPVNPGGRGPVTPAPSL